MHTVHCETATHHCSITIDCLSGSDLHVCCDCSCYSETALNNVASDRFYAKWLQDIIDIQGYPAHSQGTADPSGYIAHTAPTIAGGGGPAWSGFVIVMPWEVYVRSGDVELLRKAYGAQVKLMDFWRQSFNSSGVLTRWSTTDADNYLGDHATPHGNEGSAGEEAALLNNCYVLYCTRLMSNISKVLTPYSYVLQVES